MLGPPLMVDAVADPLMHLVRNSLDHGIETPEKRIAAGKNPCGTLTLKAFHQGGNVVIEVSDDGGGLSRSSAALSFAAGVASVAAIEELEILHDYAQFAAFLAGLLVIPLVQLQAAFGGLGVQLIERRDLAAVERQVPADALGERSELLMLYAMCGFANLGSVGMVIAGVSALAPSRREEIVQLSLWSIIPGNLSTCMTAAVVGLLP